MNKADLLLHSMKQGFWKKIEDKNEFIHWAEGELKTNPGVTPRNECLESAINANQAIKTVMAKEITDIIHRN